MAYSITDNAIWEDPKFKSLSTEAKLVFIYLFSSPHKNMAGLYRVPLGYISSDMGLPEDVIARSIRELSQAPNEMICYEGDYVLVRNFLKHNRITNEKQAKGAVYKLQEMRLKDISPVLIKAFLESADKFCAEFAGLFHTLFSGFFNPTIYPINTLSIPTEKDTDVQRTENSNQESVKPEAGARTREDEPDNLPDGAESAAPMENSGDTNGTEVPAAPATQTTEKVPYREIVAKYHEICVSYPRLEGLTKSRQKALHARWIQHKGDMGVFIRLFEKAEKSAFMKGANKNNWRASFDWMIGDNNMAKTLEGKYDDESPKPPLPGKNGKMPPSFDIGEFEKLSMQRMNRKLTPDSSG